MMGNRELDIEVAKRLGAYVGPDENETDCWVLYHRTGLRMGYGGHVDKESAWLSAPQYTSSYPTNALLLIKNLSFTINHRKNEKKHHVCIEDMEFHTEEEDEILSVAIVKCWLKLQDMTTHG